MSVSLKALIWLLGIFVSPQFLLAACLTPSERKMNHIYGLGSGSSYEAARDNAIAEVLLQLRGRIESSHTTVLGERETWTSATVQSSFRGEVEGLAISASCEKLATFYVEASLDRTRYGEHLERKILPRYARLQSDLRSAWRDKGARTTLAALKAYQQDADLADSLSLCHSSNRCQGIYWERIEQLAMLVKSSLSNVPVVLSVDEDFASVLPTIRKELAALGFVEMKTSSHLVIHIHCDQSVQDDTKAIYDFAVAEIVCTAALRNEDGTISSIAQFKGKGIGHNAEEAIKSAGGKLSGVYD